MKKIIYICDKCGAEISGESFGITGLEYDFCDSCFQKISNLIADFMKPSEKKAPEKKAPARQRKKTGTALDLGKIAALHNAGWTNVKIAEEFRCSAQTIANHLQEALEYLKNKKEEEYE